MLRTQLMLPKQLKAMLSRYAQERGISMAELIRTLLEQKLEDERKKTNPVTMLRNLTQKAKVTRDKKITSKNFRKYYHTLRDL
jgi:metal-responsive CopG/Arc/MetJ family transcriptional regulator